MSAAPIFEEIRCGVWLHTGDVMPAPEPNEINTHSDYLKCENPSCRFHRKIGRKWVAVFTDSSQMEVCRFCASDLVMYDSVGNKEIRVENLIRVR